MAAALLGFTLTALLGLALGLLFSVGNVFLRDFGKVAQTLTQFVTFSVPMIYPFTLVHERFGEPVASYYLLNPMAEAVLLIQRGFWAGTTSDPEATAADAPARPPVHARADHAGHRARDAGASRSVVFARLESKVPERL